MNNDIYTYYTQDDDPLANIDLEGLDITAEDDILDEAACETEYIHNMQIYMYWGWVRQLLKVERGLTVGLKHFQPLLECGGLKPPLASSLYLCRYVCY